MGNHSLAVKFGWRAWRLEFFKVRKDGRTAWSIGAPSEL